MEPRDFRIALRQMGLTQCQFAKDIEVDAMTVNRWARGKTKMPGAVKAYVRLLLKVEALKR